VCLWDTLDISYSGLRAGIIIYAVWKVEEPRLTETGVGGTHWAWEIFHSDLQVLWRAGEHFTETWEFVPTCLNPAGLCNIARIWEILELSSPTFVQQIDCEGITVVSYDRKGLCDQPYGQTLFGISVVDFVCGFSKLVLLYVLLDTLSQAALKRIQSFISASCKNRPALNVTLLRDIPSPSKNQDVAKLPGIHYFEMWEVVSCIGMKFGNWYLACI